MSSPNVIYHEFNEPIKANFDPAVSMSIGWYFWHEELKFYAGPFATKQLAKDAYNGR